jgi:hypothetical protein
VTSAQRQTQAELVVLVHGLYMHGIVMWPLQRWLEQCGFSCRRFSYPSMRRSVAENAARLAASLGNVEAPVVHFLCHSLGGLVVRTMLLQTGWQRPGRIVTLGTPHLGCYVAKRLGASAVLAPLIGASLAHGLDGDLPPWPPGREVGTIAGNESMGAGRVVPGLPRPNDGTVAVAETRLGADFPHTVLPVTHSSMLFSRQVAEQACVYLKTGSFAEPVLGGQIP